MIDLDEISFAEWLIELNDVAVSKGLLTDESFVSTTGQLEWYASFEVGLTPEEALYAATMDGIEFGEHY